MTINDGGSYITKRKVIFFTVFPVNTATSFNAMK